MRLHVTSHSATDDTVEEMDFSPFSSPEFCYNDLADLSLTMDDSHVEVYIDISDSLEVEEQSIAKFADGGCACKHFDGGPCCRQFPLSHYVRCEISVES